MSEFEKLINKYNEIKYKIKRLILQQEELRELGNIPKGNSNGFPTSIGNSNIEVYIMKLNDLEIKQKELEKELANTRQQVLKYIDLVPNEKGREVLELKIFSGRGWLKISSQVNYCRSRVIQLYNESMQLINSKSEIAQNY